MSCWGVGVVEADELGAGVGGIGGVRRVRAWMSKVVSAGVLDELWAYGSYGLGARIHPLIPARELSSWSPTPATVTFLIGDMLVARRLSRGALWDGLEV